MGLSPEETGYVRRGFRGATPRMRDRLEQIGAVFLGGYHAALECGSPEEIDPSFAAVDLELQGFAFEGAAMGFALLDALVPWGTSRVARFLEGAGAPHIYMVHVGVGWVWARLPLGMERAKRRLDPLLAWLAYDGWGFHEGFFKWPEYVNGRPAPQRLIGYERRVFDQGLGRSFWFVNGGNPELIARTISGLGVDRQADLWSGIGLASVYAGFAGEPEFAALRDLAGNYWPALAQGGAFASKARQRAGNSFPYTDFAAAVLCGLPGAAAARVTDATLENLPMSGSRPPYQIWRERIQRHFEDSRNIREVAA
jgi:hypothetical protein